MLYPYYCTALDFYDISMNGAEDITTLKPRPEPVTFKLELELLSQWSDVSLHYDVLTLHSTKAESFSGAFEYTPEDNFSLKVIR